MSRKVGSLWRSIWFRGPAVCVSDFDGLATLLHNKLVVSGVEPKVFVATNLNPKLVGGSCFSDKFSK
ncbi:hypothetical protein YC2023_122299 [Brassica napus]